MSLERNYDIFLSYRRIGGEYAAAYLKTELFNMGYKVFLDVIDLHEGDFGEDIEKALRQCRVLLILLSENIFENSIKNPEQDWIIKEFLFMNKRQKAKEDVKIIPIKLRNYKEPDKKEILLQKNKLLKDGGTMQKKECLDGLLELLKQNQIPFTDTKLLPGVMGLLLSWMNLKPMDEEQLRKNAEGDPVAMNELGLMYECGDIVDSERQKLKEAYKYYLKASQGDICPAAMYNLGDIYEKCSENIALLEDYGIDDYKGLNFSLRKIVADLKIRAFECYKRSSETKTKEMEYGYLPAFYKLGNICENDGNLKEAFAYYKKASDFGYPYAHNALGFFYRNGMGCEEDFAEAVKCYKKAQNEGIPEGRYNYARMNEKNNLEESIQQYEQMVMEGVGNQMQVFYAMASCYEEKARLYEKSVEEKQYLVKAVVNYQKAYNAGYRQAGKDLERCRDKYLRSDSQ